MLRHQSRRSTNAHLRFLCRFCEIGNRQNQGAGIVVRAESAYQPMCNFRLFGGKRVSPKSNCSNYSKEYPNQNPQLGIIHWDFFRSIRIIRAIRSICVHTTNLLNFSHFMDNVKITQTVTDPIIDALFAVGAHFGYRRSRRHPSAAPVIFGAKGTVEIFDLEKTKNALIAAEDFVTGLAKAGKTLLFVGGKKEAAEAIVSGATALGMPYVASRWICGTLTNFGQIRGRVDRMLDLRAKREKGELAK